MDLRLVYAILLTLLPITELRAGLPLAISYALENKVSLPLIFLIIILTNMIVVFALFLFLSFLHEKLLKFPVYKKGFGLCLKRIQRKANKLEKRYPSLEFLGLMLLVALPFPGTGAWTGTLVAWVLGLDKKRSAIAICCGIVLAGTLVFLATFGIISLFPH